MLEEKEKVPEGRTSKFISTTEREREWLPQVVGSFCLPLLPLLWQRQTNLLYLHACTQIVWEAECCPPSLLWGCRQNLAKYRTYFLAKHSTPASGIKAINTKTNPNQEAWVRAVLCHSWELQDPVKKPACICAPEPLWVPADIPGQQQADQGVHLCSGTSFPPHFSLELLLVTPH